MRGVSRRTLGVAIAIGLVATGAAAGVVLAFKSTGTDDSRLTRAAYLGRANAICESYSRRLDKIPPPLDPASPGAVYESIGLALPLLREQSAKVHALPPPRELQEDVEQFFALTDRSLEHLQEARRHAGLRELFPMVQSLSAFGRARDEAKRVSRAVGFEC
jgi:hypothetical protein